MTLLMYVKLSLIIGMHLKKIAVPTIYPIPTRIEAIIFLLRTDFFLWQMKVPI